MTYDRAAILRNAWAWARREAGWTVAYDWTPGPTYGRQRAATAAERRAIFAECLRRAWATAKAQAAYRIACAARFARPAAIMEREIAALDGANRWTPADYARRVTRDKLAVAAARHSDAIVLAADTVVAAGRRILPKADSEAEIAAALQISQGTVKSTASRALVALEKAMTTHMSSGTDGKEQR